MSHLDDADLIRRLRAESDQIMVRPGPPAAPPLSRPTAKRKGPILIGGVVAILVLLGGGLTWRELSRSPAHQSVRVGGQVPPVFGRVTVSIEMVGGPAPGLPIQVRGTVVFVNATTGEMIAFFRVPPGPSSHFLAPGRYRSYATSPDYQGGHLRCQPLQAVISVSGPSHRSETFVYACQMK